MCHEIQKKRDQHDMIIKLRHTSCGALNVDLTKWKCLGEVRDGFNLLEENETS